MSIERGEMQEIVKTYKEPVGLNLGSHSALDAWQGQRNYGLRSIIYVTPQRARICLQNPMVGKPDETVEDLPLLVKRDLKIVNDLKDIKKNEDWRSVIFIVEKYSDIVKHMDELIDLECLQIPNRAFAVYVGGAENVHMGVGSQYANAKYMRPMSMGDRIALEIRRAWKEKQLPEIVT